MSDTLLTNIRVKMYAELYRDSVGIETKIKSLVITNLCDPDYCLYTQTQNYIARNPRSSLRSGGFHIHIGYPENNIDTSLAILRYIDAIVGLASIVYDTDVERRKLYGKAGCFRLTPYG